MDPNDGPLAKFVGVGFLQLFVLDLSCVGDPPGVAVQPNHATENMSTMIQVQVSSAYTNHLETRYFYQTESQFACNLAWYIKLEYSSHSFLLNLPKSHFIIKCQPFNMDFSAKLVNKSYGKYKKYFSPEINSNKFNLLLLYTSTLYCILTISVPYTGVVIFISQKYWSFFMGIVPLTAAVPQL